MAVPKRKWSKARTRRHRSNWKLAVPSLASCPRCHDLKMPHKACKSCGYYKGRKVLETSKTKAES